jgi:hypothetical protein
MVEIHTYVKKIDAHFALTWAQIQGFPIMFTAVQLAKGTKTNSKDHSNRQVMPVNVLKPTTDELGLTDAGALFRVAGYIDDFEELAESGQYLMFKIMIRADEFYPTRLVE